MYQKTFWDFGFPVGSSRRVLSSNGETGLADRNAVRRGISLLFSISHYVIKTAEFKVGRVFLSFVFAPTSRTRLRPGKTFGQYPKGEETKSVRLETWNETDLGLRSRLAIKQKIFGVEKFNATGVKRPPIAFPENLSP